MTKMNKLDFLAYLQELGYEDEKLNMAVCKLCSSIPNITDMVVTAGLGKWVPEETLPSNKVLVMPYKTVKELINE